MLRALGILLCLLSPHLKGFAQYPPIDFQLDEIRKSKVRSLQVTKDEIYFFEHSEHLLKVEAHYMGDTLLFNYYFSEEGRLDSSNTINVSLLKREVIDRGNIKYQYSSSGQLIKMEHFEGTKRYWMETYKYNEKGLLDSTFIFSDQLESLFGTKITDTVSPIQVKVNMYDETGKLTQSHQLRILSLFPLSEEYYYNKEGRLIEIKQDWGQENFNYVPDENEHHYTSFLYEYNPNGLLKRWDIIRTLSLYGDKPSRKNKYPHKYKYTYYP